MPQSNDKDTSSSETEFGADGDARELEVRDFDTPKQVAIPKEATAHKIAESLLQTFRFALWGTLALGF